MKVGYTKDFVKSSRKYSGKVAKSIWEAISEVKAANSLEVITDLKKLVGFNNIYRIRVGSLRAFITFHIEIIDDTVIFHYLVSRGEAYSKEMQSKLKRIDK